MSPEFLLFRVSMQGCNFIISRSPWVSFEEKFEEINPYYEKVTLIGMMGTGKSKLGRQIANILKFNFYQQQQAQAFQVFLRALQQVWQVLVG